MPINFSTGRLDVREVGKSGDNGRCREGKVACPIPKMNISDHKLEGSDYKLKVSDYKLNVWQYKQELIKQYTNR